MAEDEWCFSCYLGGQMEGGSATPFKSVRLAPIKAQSSPVFVENRQIYVEISCLFTDIIRQEGERILLFDYVRSLQAVLF